MQPPPAATPEAATIIEGTVYRKSTGHYLVRCSDRALDCSISSKLRKQLEYPLAHPSSRRRRVIGVKKIATVDPVAVGDRVRVRDAGNDSGMIVEVLPRRTSVSRRASGPTPREQVVVANVDQMIPVFAVAQPEPKWGLLDRYLVDAEAAQLPAIICLTKGDLAENGTLTAVVDIYRALGYPVICTSAVTGAGIDEFRAVLRDKISVLLGKSGVGKTSLLNRVDSALNLRTGAISDATGKGIHTTSHLEMFDLACGGSIVDTPGVREFALWNKSDDLAGLFREMRPYRGLCEFGLRCTHTHELGCAIKQAVEHGAIALHRYQSYVHLME
jgi:ribosome biogenesis GTPase